MIIISGKKYDRVIEAHIVTDEACYIIYDIRKYSLTVPKLKTARKSTAITALNRSCFF